MNGKNILLIEDSQKIQNFNKRLLERQGFAVETAMTLADAKELIGRENPAGGRRPDAIVLDIGMPDGSGLEFLREFRQVSNIPVLMLTGYRKDADIILGYDSGCDGYVTKPYTFDVLLVKLKRLLQHAEQVPETVTKGALTLNVLSGQAFLNDEDMLLTQKEFALLLLFIQNEGKHVNAEYLYEKVWQAPLAGNKNALQSSVSKLRKKIRPTGFDIYTERGTGYYFE